jgi:large subunit ribosomal protein L6
VALPAAVKVAIDGSAVEVEGPKGKLGMQIEEGIAVEAKDEGLVVSRTDDSRRQRAAQGLMRSLVSNMVVGVSEGFKLELELEGVGYRAETKGNEVHLLLGYSHPVVYTLPEGVQAACARPTAITISGIDKQLVGEVAAGIRKLRPPEPYKGKGVRYAGEHIRRKAGKAGAAGG